MTIQTLALPTLPFEPFLSYSPSWQEVATFLAVVAYGVILYSLSFRYLVPLPAGARARARLKEASMIPGSLDFTLDAANLIFLGAFYLVLATVATGLAIAVQRTRRDLRPERAPRSAGSTTSRSSPRRPAAAATP